MGRMFASGPGSHSAFRTASTAGERCESAKRMKIQLDAWCYESRICCSPYLPANLTAGMHSGRRAARSQRDACSISMPPAPKGETAEQECEAHAHDRPRRHQHRRGRRGVRVDLFGPIQAPSCRARQIVFGWLGVVPRLVATGASKPESDD
jgi:hypothetical protein